MIESHFVQRKEEKMLRVLLESMEVVNVGPKWSYVVGDTKAETEFNSF